MFYNDNYNRSTRTNIKLRNIFQLAHQSIKYVARIPLVPVISDHDLAFNPRQMLYYNFTFLELYKNTKAQTLQEAESFRSGHNFGYYICLWQ